MVCIPCIVIPFLLWFFNRYIRPIVSKFWNPSVEKLEQCPFKSKSEDTGGTEAAHSEKINGVQEQNGLANGHSVTAGGDSKKDQ